MTCTCNSTYANNSLDINVQLKGALLPLPPKHVCANARRGPWQCKCKNAALNVQFCAHLKGTVHLLGVIF